MNRGTYECENKIILNDIFKLTKMEIRERVPNSSLNSVIFYDENGNSLLPKDIIKFNIICHDCNSEVYLQPINVKYRIDNQFLCKSCRVKGEKNGFYGKTHSAVVKKSMSDCRSGRLNHFHGKKHSNIFKQRLSKDRKGTWCVGEKNAMYGKSAYDVLVKKYGKIKANELWEEKSRKHQIQMILNNPFKGKTYTEETKKTIIDKNKRWMNNMKENHPDEWTKYIQKISNSLKGRIFTEEHKRNLRLSTINRIKRNKGQISPNYNPNACKHLNNLMEQTGTHIQHAENGGEYHIKKLGYWVDGYDKENNIVYEYDETYHFVNGKMKEKDIQRQKEIEEFLKCKFIRIKDEI